MAGCFWPPSEITGSQLGMRRGTVIVTPPNENATPRLLWYAASVIVIGTSFAFGFNITCVVGVGRGVRRGGGVG
jgi:hypothetical protein